MLARLISCSPMLLIETLTVPLAAVSYTHLGLGLKAIEQGYRVLFTTAAAMIATLTRALTENRLDDKLKPVSYTHLDVYKRQSVW